MHCSSSLYDLISIPQPGYVWIPVSSVINLKFVRLGCEHIALLFSCIWNVMKTESIFAAACLVFFDQGNRAREATWSAPMRFSKPGAIDALAYMMLTNGSCNGTWLYCHTNLYIDLTSIVILKNRKTVLLCYN
ncbi:MAG: hypothetical protein Ta2E_10300 [Mycoplasmoidaceae bacterium]|nr:MAG: hypothetical protein Ta2E_10300 [Mycoplasmoidaceae bacterium]